MKIPPLRIALAVTAFLLPTLLNYAVLAYFDSSWSYPEEFRLPAVMVRCVVPALIGLSVLCLVPAWRKRYVLLGLYSVLMVIWLYFPAVVFALSIVCVVSGSCL